MGIGIELWRARIGLFNGGRGCRSRKSSHQLSCGEMVSTSSVDVVAGLICLLIVWGAQQIMNIDKKRNNFSGQLSPPATTAFGVTFTSVDGAVFLFSLAYLLLLAGDVEQNPGPRMDERITFAYLSEVLHYLYEARTEWFNIGLALRISSSTLESINSEYHQQAHECLQKMMSHRITFGDPFTWADLCKCLRHSAVRRPDVANKIEDKFDDDTSLTRSHVETGRRRVDIEIEQRDLPFLAGYFDSVEYYLDALELLPHEKTNVRRSVSKHGILVGMKRLLSFWRRRDPSAATFRVLLDILRRLKKEQIAEEILSYLGVTEYDDTSLTRSHVETGRRTVDSEIEQRDLIFLAGCFDDVEYYFDAFNLSPYEKADVRTSVTTHGTQIGMNKLLSYWKEHDPSAATFRALLDIVRRLKKKQVADSIMSYIGVTVYDDTSLTRSHVETGRRRVDSEIEQRDLFFLAGYFDSVEYYLDALELSPLEKANVRKSVNSYGAHVGMTKLLSFWKERDPSAATFRALLDILERLKKEQIAEEILSYLGLTEYYSSSLYTEAMKEGFVTVEITSVLLFGIAGTGKTSTKNLLLGLPPPPVRDSTPVATSAERILTNRTVRQVSETKAHIIKDNWKHITIDELEKRIVAILHHRSKNTFGSHDDSLTEEMLKKIKPLETNMLKQPHIQEQAVTTKLEKADADVLDATSNSTEAESEVFSVATVTEELKSILSKEPRINDSEIFGTNWIYIIDSGGQPQFHNLLPIFIKGISVALYVFRLSDNLDEYPLIEYYKDGKREGEPFKSHLSAIDSFKYLVQSIQSCNTNCMLACIGTHKDHVQTVYEVQKKSARLFEMLPEAIRSKALVGNLCRAKEDFIVAVNTQAAGDERSESTRVIRELIQQHTCEEIKVPVWWYILEIILEKLSGTDIGKVLSLDQCRTVATALKFHEDALVEALKFFHEHHIFHYYPEVLPSVVFPDTQILLDKVSELIEHAAFLRDSSKKVAGLGSKLQFRDHGIITLELLREFEDYYVYKDDLFVPEKLVSIFEHLLIAAPLHSSSVKLEYFMPSLLGILPVNELDNERSELCKKITPLIVKFKNGWPHCGVFCCLQVYLMKECKWTPSIEKKPKQNAVKMNLSDQPGSVTLVDSISYIEVYHSLGCTKKRNAYSEIYSSIVKGIESACKTLGYDYEEPQRAFFCPHTQRPTTSPGNSSLHPAVILGDSGCMRCTLYEDDYYELEPKHEVWLQKDKSNRSAPSISELQTRFGLSQSQLDEEIAYRDFYSLAKCFESYGGLFEKFALCRADCASAKRKCQVDLKDGIEYALRIWHGENPVAATFNELLKIVLSLNDGETANEICRYIKQESIPKS